MAAGIYKMSEHELPEAAVRSELERILASPVFSASRRSQDFLRYVVERALAGQTDQLKERSIGIEVFGRPASYDTGDDAIVRVTAKDIRRRLTQFYEESPSPGTLRIELPSGAYVPHLSVQAPEYGRVRVDPAPQEESLAADPSLVTASWFLRPALIWSVVAVLAGVLCWQFLRPGPTPAAPVGLPPWSELFVAEHETVLVTSDVNFAALQNLLGHRLSLSDYTNHKYGLASTDPLSSAVNQLLERNQFTSIADARLAGAISRIGEAGHHPLAIRYARDMNMRDFASSSNFILLGSEFANPWVGLMTRNLNFTIEFDQQLGRQVCRNHKPQGSEAAVYVPTAVTGSSGEGYVAITFLRNPQGAGHVLIIAGTNMEGTEAGGDSIISPKRLKHLMERIGRNGGQPQLHFEAVLKVASVATTAVEYEVVASRMLPD